MEDGKFFLPQHSAIHWPRICSNGLFVRRISMRRALFMIVATVCFQLRSEQPLMDVSKIESITKLKGRYHDAEGVFKITSPRTDADIFVDQWKMPPFMGLTSWASFVAGKKNETMVMGDFVLFEDEVNP